MTSTVLIVGIAPSEVEPLLAGGVGPALPGEARCPGCGGELRGFWAGYERSVRFSRRVERLRIGRSRCRGCGGTHALLPSFVVPRRLDAAPVIAAALELAAAGRGHRPIAASLLLPATTVRGWLRRARARAALVASRLWRLAQELGALAPRPPPGERPLAALVRAAAAAQAAAAERFGAAALPDRFGLVVVLAGEGLLGAQKLALGARSGGGEDRRDRGDELGRCAMGDGGKRRDWREQEALWRYGLIREAADERLAPRERGRLVRALAGRPVKHPSGELRAPARSTLDDWIRAYRRGGFEALKPAERAPGPRTPAPLLEQAAALRRELPARTGAQIAEILRRLHGEQAPSARTVERYLRRRGLSRARLQGRERAFGRFEASVPNELWVADVLHGPLLRGRRAYLFCVLDDHSRFVVAARFAFAETTLALEGVLRTAFLALGLPDRLYVDNGSPFASAQLQRICAVLGIKLVHSSPGKPQGRGKLERFFRTVRERFLVELQRELDSLDELNRLFQAWLQQSYHRRVHSETGETPLVRYTASAPRRADAGDDPELLRQAFLWRETRTVSKTATVSLHGNRYEVDAALVGCRVDLLYDPLDLARIEVRYQDRPFGLAVPHTIGRHTHPAAAHEPSPEPPPKTGIDYLRLLEQEHEQALRRQINYRDLAAGEPDPQSKEEEAS